MVSSESGGAASWLEHKKSDVALNHAALLAQPPERAKTLANARSTYERLIQQFPKSEAYPSKRDKQWAIRNKLYYIIFSHQFYPEPPYARVFWINDDESVLEGKIEISS